MERQGKSQAQDRLLAKLQAIAPLAAEDREAIRALPLRLQTFAADVDLVRVGDQPREASVIVSGFLCRYKILGEGRRQIFSFHVPGDLPDLQGLHLPVMDNSLMTVTRSTVAFIPHGALNEALRNYPGVARALWRDTMIDAAIFREWLAGVSRRTAHQRIAHLICELYVKLASVGLAGPAGFDFPITQTEIADSLGLSTVHVNRVVQDLRRGGLIASRGRAWQILDWPGLQAAGDFDPGYLHLRSPG